MQQYCALQISIKIVDCKFFCFSQYKPYKAEKQRKSILVFLRNEKRK